MHMPVLTALDQQEARDTWNDAVTQLAINMVTGSVEDSTPLQETGRGVCHF